MIATPKCFERGCAHFLGVKSKGDETTERVYCLAFPDGIPLSIGYGTNKHLVPTKDQKNDIVYEKTTEL